MELKFIFVILTCCTLNLVTSLHLSEQNSWRTLDSGATSEKLTNVDNSTGKILLPDPIQLLTKPLPNPNQLIGQLQSSINKLVTTLNSTLSNSNLTQILGSLKNLTSGIGGGAGGGGGKPFFRLEDADHLLGNISEVIRTSSQSDAELLSNFTQSVEKNVQGALRDVEKAILQLKRSMLVNNTDSVPPTKDVPASLEKRSTGTTTNNDNVESSRSARYQHYPSVGRQGPLTLVRNGTMEFMNEIRRVFSSVTQPVRDFIEVMRQRLPTPIATA